MLSKSLFLKEIDEFKKRKEECSSKWYSGKKGSYRPHCSVSPEYAPVLRAECMTGWEPRGNSHGVCHSAIFDKRAGHPVLVGGRADSPIVHTAHAGSPINTESPIVASRNNTFERGPADIDRAIAAGDLSTLHALAKDPHFKVTREQSKAILDKFGVAQSIDVIPISHRLWDFIKNTQFTSFEEEWAQLRRANETDEKIRPYTIKKFDEKLKDDLERAFYEFSYRTEEILGNEAPTLHDEFDEDVYLKLVDEVTKTPAAKPLAELRQQVPKGVGNGFSNQLLQNVELVARLNGDNFGDYLKAVDWLFKDPQGKEFAVGHNPIQLVEATYRHLQK